MINLPVKPIIIFFDKKMLILNIIKNLGSVITFDNNYGVIGIY